MKKQFLYIVAIVLLLIITISGATFAFFSSYNNTGNILNANASDFGVDFEQGDPIEGNLELSSSKNDPGVQKTEVNIKMKSGSPLAKVTVFFNIEEMTSNLAVEGFVWEVVGVRNNVETYYRQGNFQGYDATDNRTINLVEDYTLTEENTTFTIYFWLNGDLIQDTNILNSQFSGYIGAKTDNFTATLQ